MQREHISNTTTNRFGSVFVENVFIYLSLSPLYLYYVSQALVLLALFAYIPTFELSLPSVNFATEDR